MKPSRFSETQIVTIFKEAATAVLFFIIATLAMLTFLTLVDVVGAVL